MKKLGQHKEMILRIGCMGDFMVREPLLIRKMDFKDYLSEVGAPRFIPGALVVHFMPYIIRKIGILNIEVAVAYYPDIAGGRIAKKVSALVEFGVYDVIGADIEIGAIRANYRALAMIVFLREILKRAVSVMNGRLSVCSVAVCGNDTEKNIYVIQQLYDMVKYITVFGDSESFLYDEIGERIFDVNGISLVISDSFGEMCNNDIIISTAGNSFSFYGFKKNAVYIELNGDVSFAHDLRRVRSDMAVIYDANVVWEAKTCSVGEFDMLMYYKDGYYRRFVDFGLSFEDFDKLVRRLRGIGYKCDIDIGNGLEYTLTTHLFS